MAARDAIAIEIGQRRIRALQAIRQGRDAPGAGDHAALHVKRVLVEDVPSSLDTDDVAAFGAWIGAQLDHAGIPRGRATIAVARDDVGLKRLTLPTVDENELPEMTRLALLREMPFDADRAVIDYVPVEQSGTHTTVVAVAAPERVLQRTRDIAAAAGIEIARIGLRAMGSAALLNNLGGGSDDASCVLAVDVTSAGVEFCVVDHGAIRFSRAAMLDRDAESADAVVTETRRTWLSYRIVEGASDVARVSLMGDTRVTREAAAPIGEILEAEAEVLDRHPLVESNGATMDRVWPLAGLLLESVLEIDTIDFARPHERVDHAAARRRRAILAAAILVVIVFGGWTFARRDLGGLRSDLATLRGQQRELMPAAQRYQRDTYTLAHLKRWESARVDWLGHLLALDALTPAPADTVLDTWTGALDFRGVQYDKRERTWSVPRVITIVLDGEAKDRLAADALREALVASEGYRVASSGADAPGGKRMPHGFTYRLGTDVGAPLVAAPESGGADGAGNEEAAE